VKREPLLSTPAASPVQRAERSTTRYRISCAGRLEAGGDVADIEVSGLLADSVAVAEGKLYIQGGGWNRIMVGSLPARHDRIGIGLLLRATGGLQGSHRFELRVLDPDDRELTIGSEGAVRRPSGEVTIHGSRGDEEIVLPLAINLDGMVLERPGTYQLVVAVDGKDGLTLAFTVQVRSGTEAPVVAAGTSEPRAQPRGNMMTFAA
jgi:hypothetical protein